MHQACLLEDNPSVIHSKRQKYQEEPTQEHIITVSQMVEKPSSPQQHDQENDREEPNPEQIITHSESSC